MLEGKISIEGYNDRLDKRPKDKRSVLQNFIDDVAKEIDSDNRGRTDKEFYRWIRNNKRGSNPNLTWIYVENHEYTYQGEQYKSEAILYKPSKDLDYKPVTFISLKRYFTQARKNI